MKSLITRVLTPLSLLVLLLGGFAHAQFVQQIVRAKVPFEFTANQKVFRAGQYSIVRTAPDRLDVRDSRGRVLASLITHSVQSLDKSASTKLEFSTEGGGHALTQVWFEGELIGNELPAPTGTTAVARRSKGKPVEISGGGNQ
jgi:hypothetical protein